MLYADALAKAGGGATVDTAAGQKRVGFAEASHAHFAGNILVPPAKKSGEHMNLCTIKLRKVMIAALNAPEAAGRPALSFPTNPCFWVGLGMACPMAKGSPGHSATDHRAVATLVTRAKLCEACVPDA